MCHILSFIFRVYPAYDYVTTDCNDPQAAIITKRQIHVVDRHVKLQWARWMILGDL